ncbi:MAG: site-specific integrase [Erysipelotrichales bacterium]|nr:site-specific integrase [Erysipelotrichales bacterium]
MKFKNLLQEYLEHSKDVKSDRSYKAEISLTNVILRCFESLEIKTVDCLKYESINDIIRYCRVKTKRKNNSTNKLIKHIKLALRHFGFRNHEFLSTKLLSSDTKSFKVLDSDDLSIILEYAKNRNKNQNDLLYYGLVTFLYETGCRIDELTNIKIDNINIKNRVILLEKTKNDKERYVPFTEASVTLMKRLIEASPSDYLFWNQLKKRKLCYNDTRHFFEELTGETGINNIHNHRFRKAMATELIMAGGTIDSAQVLLGHKSRLTTELYVNVNHLFALKEYNELMNKKRA